MTPLESMVKSVGPVAIIMIGMAMITLNRQIAAIFIRVWRGSVPSLEKYMAPIWIAVGTLVIVVGTLYLFRTLRL